MILKSMNRRKEKRGCLFMGASVKFFLALISFSLIIAPAPNGGSQTKDSPSVITFSYAQEKIRQGDIWKIYLSASDPEGSMMKIVCTLRKAGISRFRPSMLYLKKGMEKQFSGYLTFYTGSGLDWSGEEFLLELSILDRAGNVKGSVNLPLEFDGGGPVKRLPSDLEKELNRRIGIIDVDLSIPGD
jgi:hypothetical protein